MASLFSIVEALASHEGDGAEWMHALACVLEIEDTRFQMLQATLISATTGRGELRSELRAFALTLGILPEAKPTAPVARDKSAGIFAVDQAAIAEPLRIQRAA